MRSIAIALYLVACVAFAQKTEPAPKPQKVDFTEENLGGIRATPLGEIYLVPAHPRFKSMIKLRANFNDKLRESVHEM